MQRQKLIKKIKYQLQYRGCRELDLVFSKIEESELVAMSTLELQQLIVFLSQPEYQLMQAVSSFQKLEAQIQPVNLLEEFRKLQKK